MRLTIFGASGKTGRHLVEQALDAGHTITAVVRDPARLHPPPAAEVGRGRRAGPGGDPAGSGRRRRGRLHRGTPLLPAGLSIMSAGTASILDAMRAPGTSRLVVVSAAPVASDDHDTTCPTGSWWRRCATAWPTWR